MKITIPAIKCPSVNEMYKTHPKARGRRKKELQAMVWAELMSRRRPKFEKCHIILTAHYPTDRKRDPDNLYAKPFIDALVDAKVIEDDNNTIVQSVTLRVVTNAESEFVELELI